MNQSAIRQDKDSLNEGNSNIKEMKCLSAYIITLVLRGLKKAAMSNLSEFQSRRNLEVSQWRQS